MSPSGRTRCCSEGAAAIPEHAAEIDNSPSGAALAERARPLFDAQSASPGLDPGTKLKAEELDGLGEGGQKRQSSTPKRV